MKYCPECLSEYTDTTANCSECEGGVKLVSAAELEGRPGFRRPEDEDTTSFVAVAEAEDPYEADAFSAAVEEAQIPVFVQLRRSSAADSLTSAVNHPYWQILVPEAQREKAAAIIELRRRELVESEVDAGKAAEDEELAGEVAAKA